jgi:hypothetical protein
MATQRLIHAGVSANIMRNYIFILSLLIPINASTQTIEEKTVLIDYNDNIIDNVRGLFFSEKGDYFYYQDIQEKRIFVTNKDTLELIPYKSGIYGIYGKDGEITTLYTSQDSFYYKNTNSTLFFPNGYGRIVKHITDFTTDNVALTTEKGDSVFYFLNGSLISATHKENSDGFINSDKWCSFSEDGNSLYYIKKDSIYYLYFDMVQVDSSDRKYDNLVITNDGDYLYGNKARKSDNIIDSLYFRYFKKQVKNTISVDSRGNTYSYHKNKKRTLVYKNQTLILDELGDIKVYYPDELYFFGLQNYKRSDYNINRFDYFELNNQGYLIWNGALSKPLKKFQPKTFGEEYPIIGELLAVGINKNGFYLFQYIGKRNTILIINNEIINLGNQIDKILENSIYFNNDEIVFYAICKNKIKRFKITD